MQRNIGLRMDAVVWLTHKIALTEIEQKATESIHSTTVFVIWITLGDRYWK
jgi:hypothetical protein